MSFTPEEARILFEKCFVLPEPTQTESERIEELETAIRGAMALIPKQSFAWNILYTALESEVGE